MHVHDAFCCLGYVSMPLCWESCHVSVCLAQMKMIVSCPVLFVNVPPILSMLHVCELHAYILIGFQLCYFVSSFELNASMDALQPWTYVLSCVWKLSWLRTK